MTAASVEKPAKGARRAPRPAQAKQEITYEQYLRMPVIKQRYEIVDGEMIMSPAPSDRHQFAIGDIFDAIQGFAGSRKLGFVLLAPLDVVIHRAPRLRVRQPDIAFWSSERVGGGTRAAFRAARENDLPPDLVVEVLSPEETRRRLAGKLTDYAAIGVQEVWLVGEQLEAIEVLTLENGAFIRGGLYGRGDSAVSRVLPGFTLEVDTLFDEEM